MKWVKSDSDFARFIVINKSDMSKTESYKDAKELANLLCGKSFSNYIVLRIDSDGNAKVIDVQGNHFNEVVEDLEAAK